MLRHLLYFVLGTCSLAQEPPSFVIGEWMRTDLADGFDFPVGGADGTAGYQDLGSKRHHAGWRSDGVVIDALHLETSEVWNGRGGGSTDAEQPVHALAAGSVVGIEDGAVWLEHRFLDNGQPQRLLAGYSGIVGTKLQIGDRVQRRQQVGRIARGTAGQLTQLTITLRHLVYREAATWPTSVSDFIRTHRRLLVPANEKRVLIAIKHAYQLHVCEKGKVTQVLPMALGQNGRQRKKTDGDNRTPEGDYRITQKALGPFEGDYGAYLGAAWLRLGYPNAYDARAALHEGRISKPEHATIVTAASRGSLAPTGTSLGDGIGIHGWIKDWPDGENDLTWGCISLKRADLLTLYSLVTKGTHVLIIP